MKHNKHIIINTRRTIDKIKMWENLSNLVFGILGMRIQISLAKWINIEQVHKKLIINYNLRFWEDLARNVWHDLLKPEEKKRK